MWSRGRGVGQEKVDRRPPKTRLVGRGSFKFKFKVGAAAAMAVARLWLQREGAAAGSESCSRAAAAAVGTRTDQTSLRFFAPFRSWLILGRQGNMVVPDLPTLY